MSGNKIVNGVKVVHHGLVDGADIGNVSGPVKLESDDKAEKEKDKKDLNEVGITGAPVGIKDDDEVVKLEREKEEDKTKNLFANVMKKE